MLNIFKKKKGIGLSIIVDKTTNLEVQRFVQYYCVKRSLIYINAVDNDLYDITFTSTKDVDHIYEKLKSVFEGKYKITKGEFLIFVRRMESV